MSFGEKLVEEMEKIANALENIPDSGFMRHILVLYIRDKTGIGKQKIETILEAIKEFKNEINKMAESGDKDSR